MKNNSIRLALLFFMGIVLCFDAVNGLYAEEFHCEVFSLQGSATVKDAQGQARVIQEGDLIAKDQTIETTEGSTVVLAFDRERKNVARIEENSKIEIKAIYPTQLNLDQGGIFAKLKSLPKNSTFAVKTPTAVATVRGTEYRTTFTQGQTEVFNVSPSKIFIYGVKADGSADEEQVVMLEQSKKTQVTKVGAQPQAPQELSANDQELMDSVKIEIQTKIREAENSGRVSTIQSVADLETIAGQKVELNNSDESRVVDLRRRPFKKATVDEPLAGE